MDTVLGEGQLAKEDICWLQVSTEVNKATLHHMALYVGITKAPWRLDYPDIPYWEKKNY